MTQNRFQTKEDFAVKHVCSLGCENLPCLICGWIAYDKANLRRHIKDYHKEVLLDNSVDNAPVVKARGTNVENVRTPEGKTEGSSRGITT